MRKVGAGAGENRQPTPAKFRWSGRPRINNYGPFECGLAATGAIGVGGLGCRTWWACGRRRRLQPALSFLGCLVSLQPALWLIGNRAGKPAFVEKDVEVVFPESLAVPDSQKILDFAGFAGLFEVLEGLEEGQLVVVEGNYDLKEGTLITLQEI